MFSDNLSDLYDAAVGLTFRYLIVPISERQDTVGPSAKTVKDAARIL
jgi:amidase